MALQDLTPQLRTRLSRMERAVGWFVLVATLLLLAGFVYYVYNTATRKGWFLTKAPYYTFLESASGLRVGDPVRLMGFDAGTITKIESMPAAQFIFDVYVQFRLKDPYYGYMWTEGSRVSVNTADLLGQRVLEVSRGTGGYPTYTFNPLRTMTIDQARQLQHQPWWKLAQELYDASETNRLVRALEPLSNVVAVVSADQQVVVLDTREERRGITGVWDDEKSRYEPWSKKAKGYWLIADESPGVTERVQQLVSQVQQSLPGVFYLTNQLAGVLSNSATLTANLADIATTARPLLSNLTVATARLDQPGALGEWLLPTNLNRRLESTLDQAGTTLGTATLTFESANTNLSTLARELERSLENLAAITSNLNTQVQANTNLLKGISDTVIHADELVQGLKRHWLLRSAFKEKPGRSNEAPAPSLPSPKQKGER